MEVQPQTTDATTSGLTGGPPPGAGGSLQPPPQQAAPQPSPEQAQQQQHKSVLSDILHAVGDVLGGPTTKSVVNQQTGAIEKVPLTRQERIAHGIATGLTGISAGLAQHGPGAAGRAGIQASQMVQQQQNTQFQHELEQSRNIQAQTLQQAQIAHQNNMQLLAQRSESRLEAEDKARIVDSNRAFDLLSQEKGFVQPPIMVGGQDINGKPGNEAEMMKYFTDPENHKVPAGYAAMYLPTIDEATGQTAHVVKLVPLDVMKQTTTMPAADFKNMTGLDAPGGKEVSLTMGSALGLKNAYQESILKAAQTAGEEEKTKEAKELLPYKEKESQAQTYKAEQEGKKAGLDAATGGGPVYAFDGQNTVLTTKADAMQRNLQAIRPVKQADIEKDQHDIKVLNDIQIKSNNVAQAASAMDSKSWSQALIAAKELADNPNTTFNTLIKSKALANASPQALAYIIATNSLRESAMGMQKVLTGTARTNETQLQALLNTLPGYEPNANVVKQKLAAFDQNIGMLRQGLPSGTGIEHVPGTSQAVYARNPQTNQRVMSTDGGKTWQPAQ